MTLRSEVEKAILRALAQRETVVSIAELKEALRAPDCNSPHAYEPSGPEVVA